MPLAHNKSAHHWTERAVLAEDQEELPPVVVDDVTDAADIGEALVKLGLIVEDDT